jgi:alpha-L-rhamnosidase
MVHTFILWYCSDIAAKTAGALGIESEADDFLALAERTREAFNARFYNEETGSYGDAGGNILALKMGVPEEQYEQVMDAVRSGLKKNKGHLDTGIIGTRFFFEVLAGHGLNLEAYEAMNKRTEPSYGHWLELGATTSRENWNENGSHNHPMFGGGLVWLYRNLAGMQSDPDEPGYRHIIFKPQPVGELDYVSYATNTSYGRGGISWENEADAFVMEIRVPVSCRATVHVPASDPSQVREGGKLARRAEGVTFREVLDGYSLFEVESGGYSFRVRK